MAQEKILGRQLNITDCAAELNSSMVTDLVTDTSPTLGGDLDTAGHDITSSGSINLVSSVDINLETPDRQYVNIKSEWLEIRGERDAGSPLVTFGEGRIEFYQSTVDGGKKVSIYPSHTAAADTVFRFPPTTGTPGQVLTAGSPVSTAGLTRWADPVGGSSNNWLTAHAGVDFVTAPQAYSDYSIALGHAAKAGTAGSPVNTERAVAIGYGATASAAYSSAFGSFYTTATGEYSVAIGTYAKATHNQAVSLGSYCASGATAQVNVGYGVWGDATANRATFGYGGSSPVGVGANQNLVTLYDGGKCEPVGDNAMFVAPPYLKASLPTAVAGGMIFVSDAVTGHAGSPASATGVICFGQGSPAAWIDIVTGLPVV